MIQLIRSRTLTVIADAMNVERNGSQRLLHAKTHWYVTSKSAAGSGRLLIFKSVDFCNCAAVRG